MVTIEYTIFKRERTKENIVFSTAISKSPHCSAPLGLKENSSLTLQNCSQQTDKGYVMPIMAVVIIISAKTSHFSL